MDNLERFIKDNKKGFDNELAPDIWEDIKGEIQPRRTLSPNWKITRNIAAGLVIFFSAWFGKDIITADRDTAPQQAQIAFSESMQNKSFITLMEAESYYSGKIEKRKNEIFQLTNNNNEISQDITQEMVELDVVYSSLKEELKDNYDNEKVIEAMIQTYRIKLNILNTIHANINKPNTDEEYKEI